MASLDSSIRSAARATYSAYKRQPIRWRLAGGSAALTLVILLGLRRDRRHADDARDLQGLQPPGRPRRPTGCRRSSTTRTSRLDSKRQPAVRVPDRPQRVRGVQQRGDPRRHRQRRRFAGSKGAPDFGPPKQETEEINGWRVETRELQIYEPPTYPGDQYDFRIFAQYGRRISDVRATANRVKLFLGLGVLGGTALALLAGLATARRAMEPIAELTDAAREIERTRDPAARSRARRPTTRSPSSRRRWSRCCTRSTTRARRPRPRSRASASSSPTPRTSCARR